jgi:transposase
MLTELQLQVLKAHCHHVKMDEAVRLCRTKAGFDISYNAACTAKRRHFHHKGYKKRGITAAVVKRRQKLKQLWRETMKCGDFEWKKYATATQLRLGLQNVHEIEVKLPVVRHDLREMGLRCRVRRPVPSRQRVDQEKQITYRNMVRRLKIKSEDIIFSDEVILSTKDNTGRYEWVEPGQEPFPRENKSRRNYFTLHVWAAVGVGYKSALVIIPRKAKDEDGEVESYNLNAAGYRKRCLGRISTFMAENPDRYFLQDGARPHTAQSTKDFIARKGWKFLQNPPYTPQWNMIELVWKEFHARIGQKAPKTQEELLRVALEVWAGMDDYIDKICGRFRKALNKMW